MSKGIQTFRETDLRKMIRGARKAGLEVVRFEIDRDGKIAIVTAGKAAPEADPLDEEGRRIA
jgi:hypothetical protein